MRMCSGCGGHGAEPGTQAVLCCICGGRGHVIMQQAGGLPFKHGNLQQGCGGRALAGEVSLLKSVSLSQAARAWR